MHRKYFTKLELLVAAVCFVVLAALLLPALQSASSRGRTICASRLGQLASANTQFEMAKRKYPGYLQAFGEDADGMVKVGSWAVPLLPYLESGPLYDRWVDPTTTGPWNRRGGGTSKMNEEFFPTKPIFLCAADSNLGDYMAACSFAANAGFFPDTLPANYEGLSAHEIARESTRPANGVFSNQLPKEIKSVYTKNELRRVLGSRIDRGSRADDIRDGLTQTIAFTESINADSWAQVGHDSGWDQVEIDGETFAGDDLSKSWSPRVRVGIVWQYRAQPAIEGVLDYKLPPKIDFRRTRKFSPEQARPSSHHTGVFNAAMLGGSVATISNDIDYRVLQALMTPHTRTSDVPDQSYTLTESDYQ